MVASWARGGTGTWRALVTLTWVLVLSLTTAAGAAMDIRLADPTILDNERIFPVGRALVINVSGLNISDVERENLWMRLFRGERDKLRQRGIVIGDCVLYSSLLLRVGGLGGSLKFFIERDVELAPDVGWLGLNDRESLVNGRYFIRFEVIAGVDKKVHFKTDYLLLHVAHLDRYFTGGGHVEVGPDDGLAREIAAGSIEAQRIAKNVKEILASGGIEVSDEGRRVAGLPERKCWTVAGVGESGAVRLVYCDDNADVTLPQADEKG